MTHTHTNTHTYTHTHTYTQYQTHTHTHKQTPSHTHTYTHVHTHSLTHTRTHTLTHTHTYTHTLTHIYTHSPTRTRTHRHTQFNPTHVLPTGHIMCFKINALLTVSVLHTNYATKQHTVLSFMVWIADRYYWSYEMKKSGMGGECCVRVLEERLIHGLVGKPGWKGPLGRSRGRWTHNTKSDPRIRIVGRGLYCCGWRCRHCELLWKRWWNLCFLKMQAEELIACQEGLTAGS